MSTKNARGARPLVIHTKFAHAGFLEPVLLDRSNESRSDQKHGLGLVRVRFAPRGVSVEILSKDDLAVYRRYLRWQRLRGVQHLMSDQRVAKCFRVRVTPVVRVLRSAKVHRAHYGGLVVCGGVWNCPVCSAKITERRRKELEGANDKKFAKLMVTYTLQHERGDKLKKLICDLRDGLRDMKHSRGYKNLIERLQIVGSVGALEVTISNLNGWHPHIHALMFSKLKQSHIDAAIIRDELSQLFVTALQKRGRYVHSEIGVNVRCSKDIKQEYLAKFGEADTKQSTWSLAAEITKSPVKSGRGDDHFHPFELVDMYLSRNIEAGRKFIEYAVSMKGKKQLVYTRGLRELLGLGVELSDQEIAEREDQNAIMFAEIKPEHWTIILRHEKRGQLLDVASRGNYNEMVAYMRALGCDDFGKDEHERY